MGWRKTKKVERSGYGDRQLVDRFQTVLTSWHLRADEGVRLLRCGDIPRLRSINAQRASITDDERERLRSFVVIDLTLERWLKRHRARISVRDKLAMTGWQEEGTLWDAMFAETEILRQAEAFVLEHFQ